MLGAYLYKAKLKTVDICKIQNEKLTKEKVKEIIGEWKENHEENFPKEWEKLLNKSIGKTTIEWIKSQDVNLIKFTKGDYNQKPVKSCIDYLGKLYLEERLSLEEFKNRLLFIGIAPKDIDKIVKEYKNKTN